MSGKIYVGSPNGVVVRAKDVVVGDSNNVAHRAKGVFVGNSSDKAVKIWPASVLPIGYQEVEWIKFLKNTSKFNTYVKTYTQPRIVLTFKPYKTSDSSPIDRGLVYSNYLEVNSYIGDGYGRTKFYDMTINLRMSNESRYSTLQLYNYYEPDSTLDDPSTKREGVFNVTTNKAEGVLSDVVYRIDFNNISNGISNYYLYCEEGYYSIPANNRIASHKKMDLSPFKRQNENTYIYLINYVSPHSSSFNKCEMIFYHCTMYNNSGTNSGEIIHDYYPCCRKADNQVGLYDVVDRIFIQSETSLSENTDYILGPEV